MFLSAAVFCAGQAFGQKDKRKKITDQQAIEFQKQRAEEIFTVAEKYFILEDYAKALAYYQSALELGPENPTVHYKIAEVLSKSKKEEDHRLAITSVENALRLDKKNKYYYLLAANLYGEVNDYAKAEQTLETMLKEVKGTEEYLYELAAMYQYDKKPEEAIKVYNRAEATLGINEISSLEKQKLYFRMGKIDEAIAEGEKLINTNPDEERYAMGFAETLAQNGQRKKAIDVLEKFSSTHPDAGSSRILLAGLYRDDGQEQKARDLLLKVVSDPTVDSRSKVIVLGTYNAQIAQMMTRNQRDQALEDFALQLFSKMKTTHGADPNVHLAGGDLLLTLKRLPEAEVEYLEAIRRGASSFEAWQNLLSIESEANKFDSLIVHTEKGLELFPNQAMMYYFNGYAHIRKNHYREAATSLEMARKLAAGNAALVSDVNSMLGDAYNGTKEYAKSDKAYEDALQFNPNNDYVLNNYSYYLALRKENLDKAERMAAQAVHNQPTNASFLDTYAWVLYMHEKYKDARKIMERALAQPEPSSTLFEHYGDILFQLGDVDGAVRQWEKARSLTTQHELIDKKIANRRLY
ncbi:MAG: tetratricopeptide repeat protein [Bacteroidetes bacterium]|nr:tetratricopeptide repeat protein [Bacteroidota bacterium]